MFGNSKNKRLPDWKFFGLRHIYLKLLILLSFAALIIPTLIWMHHNYYVVNPFVPHTSNLQGTDLYGRNTEGDLQSTSIFFLIENAVALLVLLPYSFSRYYWVRVLVLQVLFGFWLFVMLATAMHSSSLYTINALGVFGINILIGIWLASSVFADAQNWKFLRTNGTADRTINF